jgi:hypothetical protein
MIGIPARDLTDDEVRQYGGAAALIATGLYEPMPVHPDKTVKATAKEPVAEEAEDGRN